MLRMKHRFSKWSVGLALALATGLAGAQQLRADVLKLAPTDSLAVMKIKNVGATNKKAADLFAKLGVSAMKPELADPLAAFKSEVGIKDGLNEAGELGVIFLPAAQWPKDEAEGDKRPGVVVLIPVTDYKAFLGNFKDVKTDGEVTEIQINGQPSYFASWGEYAAMAPTKEYATAKGGGLTVNAAATKEFAEKDLVLWANVPALKAALGPKLTEAKTKALEEMGQGLQGEAKLAKYTPVFKAAASQVFAAAETFLSNAKGATFSVNLSDAGINGAIASEFEADSYLGKLTSALKGSTESFTAGLPTAPYIFYGGATLDGKTLSGLLNDFVAPIMKEFSAVEAANGEDVQKALDSMNKMLTASKSTNFGWIAPRGAMGTESLFQIVYVTKGDAKGYVEGMKGYGESYAKLMQVFSTGGAMPFQVTYKPAAKTLDGVTFDVMSVGPSANPKTPEEAQMAQMMQFMYGPGGLSYTVGAVNDSTALMGMGLPDAMLSKVIASSKAGGDDLAKLAHVQATAKALPEKPVAEAFFALDELIRTGVMYARNFGMPFNPQLPENLPPIGYAVEANGTVMRVDGHVPTELVQSLVAAFIQMQMQMQGGPGGL